MDGSALKQLSDSLPCESLRFLDLDLMSSKIKQHDVDNLARILPSIVNLITLSFSCVDPSTHCVMLK